MVDFARPEQRTDVVAAERERERRPSRPLPAAVLRATAVQYRALNLGRCVVPSAVHARTTAIPVVSGASAPCYAFMVPTAAPRRCAARPPGVEPRGYLAQFVRPARAAHDGEEMPPADIRSERDSTAAVRTRERDVRRIRRVRNVHGACREVIAEETHARPWSQRSPVLGRSRRQFFDRRLPPRRACGEVRRVRMRRVELETAFLIRM